MAIFLKSALTKHIKKLEQKYQNLLQELAGSKPNSNNYSHYCDDSLRFEEAYTDIDEMELKDAIAGLEFILKELKSIKTLKAKIK